MALSGVPGDWVPPPDVIAAAEATHNAYRNPPLVGAIPQQHRGLTRTQLPIAPGTLALRNAIVARFPACRQTYMPGRSRPMPLDSMPLDMHQAGRAIDFMVYTNKALGDQIANYLVLHNNELGIQFVVWNGNKFNCDGRAGSKIAVYGGTIKHRDHPHVELTPAAAGMTTAGFRGVTPPTAAATEAATTEASAPYADYGAEGSWYVPVLLGAGALVLLGGAALLARHYRR